ncbi:ABC transporter permease [Frankia sp. CN7]|uniref:ABC transporter permease n=1 Tax=Frankia nepalensis TaxID=1836974 RepID=A0A937URH3_9ACTN|nr:ABC transporter permease [Frankia nepalensis]MBL7632864.1 ABC transporter permease [Frankia nepalensis]
MDDPAPREPDGPSGGAAGPARAAATQLLLGARLAVAGGGSAWLRTALTGLGVGLGVALLLVAASVPAILAARADRHEARDWEWAVSPARGDTTMQVRDYRTETGGIRVSGLVLRPEGTRPPVPPGLSAVPGPGEMAVSPALARLLDSAGDGSSLAARLPFHRVATIGRDGLSGPNELFVYIGAPAGSELRSSNSSTVARIDRFGVAGPSEGPLPAALMMLVIVIVAVLLLPIGAFTAAAVRFGGEARDRQLAAVRLLGADPAMARRIAAGGALASAAAGCLAGAALFVVGRACAQRFTLFGASVFTDDIRPVPALVALVLAAVPASAVAVTLFALRGVVVEPFGVVRRAPTTRRRLWWRLAMPAIGIALVLPVDLDGPFGAGPQAQLAAGVVLTLLGVTVLLPWLVEAAVRRLGAGPISWQLAVRRLQLDSATTVRSVAAVSVAVAGAIALQMVFTVAEQAFVRPDGTRDSLVAVEVDGSTDGRAAPTLARSVTGIEGTTGAVGFAKGYATSVEPIGGNPGYGGLGTVLTVADCPTLRQLARISSCADGDVFLAAAPYSPQGWWSYGPAGPTADDGSPPLVLDPEQIADPATRQLLDSTSEPVLPGPGVRLVVGDPPPVEGDAPDPDRPVWTIPATAVVTRTNHPMYDGVLATPGAVPTAVVTALRPTAVVDVDRRVPGALDRLTDAAARVDPLMTTMAFGDLVLDPRFGQIRLSLYVGIVVVLGLIGASLLVTVVEQLRERRRVLAVLVAFGTRRSTLAASVLWQTAVPMVLGVGLATGVGLGLGSALLHLVDWSPTFDWAHVATVAAATVAVVAGVTVASLPVLWRLMRPAGLRAE